MNAVAVLERDDARPAPADVDADTAAALALLRDQYKLDIPAADLASADDQPTEPTTAAELALTPAKAPAKDRDGGGALAGLFGALAQRARDSLDRDDIRYAQRRRKLDDARADRARRRADRNKRATDRWDSVRAAGRGTWPGIVYTAAIGMAVHGQISTIVNHHYGPPWASVVGAVFVEGVALAVAFTGHELRLMGERAVLHRAVTWGAALGAACLNAWGHQDVTYMAGLYAVTSIGGVLVWELRTGWKARKHLRAIGKLGEPMTRYGTLWLLHPFITWAAYRIEARARIAPEAAGSFNAAYAAAEERRAARRPRPGRLSRAWAALFGADVPDQDKTSAGTVPDKTAGDGGQAVPDNVSTPDKHACPDTDTDTDTDPDNASPVLVLTFVRGGLSAPGGQELSVDELMALLRHGQPDNDPAPDKDGDPKSRPGPKKPAGAPSPAPSAPETNQQASGAGTKDKAPADKSPAFKPVVKVVTANLSGAADTQPLPDVPGAPKRTPKPAVVPPLVKAPPPAPDKAETARPGQRRQGRPYPTLQDARAIADKVRPGQPFNRTTFLAALRKAGFAVSSELGADLWNELSRTRAPQTKAA